MQTLSSEPLRRVFCCPKLGSFEISRRKPERETRIPGLALEARAQARGACRRERGFKPDTDGSANLERVRPWRRGSQRRNRICFIVWFAASYGSTDAGGEDVGYFAPWKERVRIPPVTHAPWRWPARAAARHGSGCVAERQEPELTSLKPRSPVPQRTLPTADACIGEAVVKMSVTSGRAGSIPAHSQGRSPARAATASPIPRQPFPRSVVKIADTSSATREVAGSNPARRRMRR
jgi:hypothetical protein